MAKATRKRRPSKAKASGGRRSAVRGPPKAARGRPKAKGATRVSKAERRRRALLGIARKKRETKKRSLAAKKGWATRRAEERADQPVVWAGRMRDAFVGALEGVNVTDLSTLPLSETTASASARWTPAVDFAAASHAADAVSPVVSEARGWLAIVRVYDRTVGWFTPARGLSTIAKSGGQAAESMAERAEHYREQEAIQPEGDEDGGQITRVDVYVRAEGKRGKRSKEKARRAMGVRHRNGKLGSVRSRGRGKSKRRGRSTPKR